MDISHDHKDALEAAYQAGFKDGSKKHQPYFPPEKYSPQERQAYWSGFDCGVDAMENQESH